MSKKVLIGLLFLANSAQAGFVGARLLGALGITAVGSKVASYQQKQKFQKTRLTVQDYTDLKESFGETWDDWRWYPDSAKLVRDTFRQYGVDPKKALIGYSEETFGCHAETDEDDDDFEMGTPLFIFNKYQVEGVQDRFSKMKADNFYGKSSKKELKEYQEKINMFTHTISHELGHYLNDESEAKELGGKLANINCRLQLATGTSPLIEMKESEIHELERESKSLRQQYVKLQRKNELKADLISNDPQVLRAGAKDFLATDFIITQHSSRESIQEFVKDDAHPINFERYLACTFKACNIEEQQKREATKQKQFEERCLMVP